MAWSNKKPVFTLLTSHRTITVLISPRICSNRHILSRLTFFIFFFLDTTTYLINSQIYIFLTLSLLFSKITCANFTFLPCRMKSNTKHLVQVKTLKMFVIIGSLHLEWCWSFGKFFPPLWFYGFFASDDLKLETWWFTLILNIYSIILKQAADNSISVCSSPRLLAKAGSFLWFCVGVQLP